MADINNTIKQNFKFLREEAPLFTCLCFDGACCGTVLVVKVVSDPGGCLKSDIDLLSLMIESNKMDHVTSIRLRYLNEGNTIKHKSLIHLCEVLGRLPSLGIIAVEAKTNNHSNNSSATSSLSPPLTFPVEALTAFFLNCHHLEDFTMVGKIQGDRRGFKRWARAISTRRGNILRYFHCWHDLEGDASWEPSSNRVQSRKLSPWDPVLHALVSTQADSLYELNVSTGDPTSMRLSKETSCLLAKHRMFPVGMRPTFSNVNDLVLYCGYQADCIVHVRFNIYGSLLHNVKDNQWLRGLLKDTHVTQHMFSLTYQAYNNNDDIRNQDHAAGHDVDVCWSGSDLDMSAIEAMEVALRMEYRDQIGFGGVSEGLLEVPDECPVLDRFQGLWGFDPATASPWRWCQLLAALGNLRQDDRSLLEEEEKKDEDEEEELDLTPLFVCLSENHDKLFSAGGALTNEPQQPDSKASTTMEELRACNQALQADNASLTADKAEISEEVATPLQKVAILEDELPSMKLLMKE